MSTPAPGDQTTWAVINQVEKDQVQPAGPPVRGVQVFYQTGKGNQGSVFVPYAQYTPDNVYQLVGQAAARMDQVGALGNGQTG